MAAKSWSWAVALVLAAGLGWRAAGEGKAELIHRWSFTDGATDSVGKVHGKLKGSAKVAEGKLVLANGDKSSADEGIGYLEFPEPILPTKGSASIEIWFTGKDVEAFSRLLDIGAIEDSSGHAFVYMTMRTGDDSSRAAISATDAASKTNVDGVRLDDGKPHMAALIIDDKAKKLYFYIDGKEAASAADLGDNTLDKVKQDHRWVGKSSFDSDGALSATIDELRVYDDALTAEQVAAAFKAGADATGGK